MALAKPDPEEYRETAEESATVEEVAGTDDGKLYHVSGIYKALCYDHWGIEADHGDYNAEWLGRHLAELLAVARFREETGHAEVKTVVHNNTEALSMYDLPEQKRYDQTYYEVMVIPA